MHAKQTWSSETKTLPCLSTSETELCPLGPSGKPQSKGDHKGLEVFRHAQTGAVHLLVEGDGDSRRTEACATPLFT